MNVKQLFFGLSIPLLSSLSWQCLANNIANDIEKVDELERSTSNQTKQVRYGDSEVVIPISEKRNNQIQAPDPLEKTIHKYETMEDMPVPNNKLTQPKSSIKAKKSSREFNKEQETPDPLLDMN